jgi:hypothetical protein
MQGWERRLSDGTIHIVDLGEHAYHFGGIVGPVVRRKVMRNPLLRQKRGLEHAVSTT